MAGFIPTIRTESSSYLERVHNKKYKTGEKFGSADVAFADDNIVEICYQRSSNNCQQCPKECPFNSNPNRKEV